MFHEIPKIYKGAWFPQRKYTWMSPGPTSPRSFETAPFAALPDPQHSDGRAPFNDADLNMAPIIFKVNISSFNHFQRILYIVHIFMYAYNRDNIW